MKNIYIFFVTFTILCGLGFLVYFIWDLLHYWQFALLNLVLFLIFLGSWLGFNKSLQNNPEQSGLILMGSTFGGLFLSALVLVVLAKLKIIDFHLLLSFGGLFVIYLILITIIARKKLEEENADKKH